MRDRREGGRKRKMKSKIEGKIKIEMEGERSRSKKKGRIRWRKRERKGKRYDNKRVVGTIEGRLRGRLIVRRMTLTF